MSHFYEKVDGAPTEEHRAAAINEVLRSNNALRFLQNDYNIVDTASIPYHGNGASFHIGGKYFTGDPYSTQQPPVFILRAIQNGEEVKLLVLDDMDGVYIEKVIDMLHPDTKPTPVQSAYVPHNK